MLGKLEELVLLGAIKGGTEATAATIYQIVADTRAKTAFGSVFTTLERLEEKKFLRSSVKVVVTQAGSKERKVFEVTGAGRQALYASLQITDSLVVQSGFSVA